MSAADGQQERRKGNLCCLRITDAFLPIAAKPMLFIDIQSVLEMPQKKEALWFRVLLCTDPAQRGPRQQGGPPWCRLTVTNCNIKQYLCSYFCRWGFPLSFPPSETCQVRDEDNSSFVTLAKQRGRKDCFFFCWRRYQRSEKSVFIFP